MPIELTDEMTAAVNSSLADRVRCVLATASKDGSPDLAIRGSMMIYDKEHLAYWERSRNESLANLGENQRVAVYYRNPEKRMLCASTASPSSSSRVRSGTRSWRVSSSRSSTRTRSGRASAFSSVSTASARETTSSRSAEAERRR